MFVISMLSPLSFSLSLSLSLPLPLSLLQLDHPSIVKFHDSFMDKDFFCIITEYCEASGLTLKSATLFIMSSHVWYWPYTRSVLYNCTFVCTFASLCGSLLVMWLGWPMSIHGSNAPLKTAKALYFTVADPQEFICNS